ncbi:MAG: hypothetical protein HFG20_07020 [Anaerotruncus sp.]|nr:hypothetical protein [Anaerotruncus sp.]
MEFDRPLHFFLGANTPQGFVSRFDQLADPQDGWREFVIKGGPGTGKSTLMKRIASNAAPRCRAIERIHCSSDVDSLDGVILHDVKTSIADGTSPHVIEPKYPGAFEQLVDLSSCWNAQQLFSARQEILSLSSRISRCHEHCCRFLGAAGSLLGDNYRIALDATSVQKVVRAATRIAQAELKGSASGRGKESVRFLSAVTNQGITLFSDTANTLCERIYLIDDPHGASSRLLLGVLRSQALEHGLDVYSCYCPLSPFEKLEHLFIPQLKVGFMTRNEHHIPQVEPYKIIRSRRFTDSDALRKARKRITFNRKAAAQMLDSAARLLADAKKLHDQLETYYIDAMDFEKVDAIGAQTLSAYEQIFQQYQL